MSSAAAPMPRLAAGVLVLLTTFALLPAHASHPQSQPNGDVVRFTQVSGNEWWVQVRLAGPDGASASSVRAMDTGGPWVALKSQTWTSDHTWWAASFRIEPGHQVRFSASFPDGVTGFQSCWFDHPTGVERCGATSTTTTTTSSTSTTTSPPPASSSKEAEAFATRTAGGRQSDGRASGGAVWNLWSNGHIQDSLDVGAAGTITVVARGQPLGNVWPTMVISVDGIVVRTVTVSSTTLANHAVSGVTPGRHTVRVAFTNDAMSGGEDRNLILDRVAAPGTSPDAGPWTLAAGQTATWSFQWPGGPGHFVADARTMADLNLRPRLRVELDGVIVREAPVAGPVGRPAWAPFDGPAGTHTVRFTAIGGTVVVSEAGVSASAPATSFTGAAARIHQGGVAESGGWSFTDYGSLDSRIVVLESGWYDLRVQGIGTIADVGPLVHLNLNRTVVAEAVQGTTIDLSVRRYLVAGVGYSLGASFENPWPGRTARFDRLSVTPAGAPPPLPTPVHVDPVNDPTGWPQYGRDGYNSRSSTQPGLPTSSSADDLQLKWRTAVDGSVTGTPVVVEGRVYVGTWENSLYALDEVTGAVLWRVSLPAPVDGSVAVADGKVVVSAVQTVLAFDATTGSQLWTTSNLGGHTWSSPTIDGDAIFIGLGVGRGYVVRLDLDTGAIVWSTPTTEHINGGARVWASPLVPPGSGLVVVGTSPGTINEESGTIDALIAYDRETGTMRWVNQFFPRDQNREANHEETLRENRDISGTPHLAFLDGRPVVLASQKHGPAWIVDLTDGSLVSGGRLLEPRAALIGSGGVADGIRVVSSAEPDRIAAFDMATGDLLWQHEMPATEFAPVAIANGVVWVGSWGGKLHAFDLRTGQDLVQLDAGGGVLGGASLADGRVFVGSLQQTPATINFYDSLGKLPGYVSAWGP